MYYRNKIESLQNIFGTQDLELKENALRVGRREFSIRQDVIDLTGIGQAPEFAEDIQYTFGAEWTAHGQILPEHREEFSKYFDLVDLSTLQNARVADLGCGSGRWSFFLKDLCREIVLVDFSEAIYVARENLRGTDHCLFFKGDVTQLPFADNFADLIISLGVLHHLPVPALEAVKNLKCFSPKLLIFLYYALDNRPFYFRMILGVVTGLRRLLAHIRWPLFRDLFSWFGALFIYMPMICIGRFLQIFGRGRWVPLYEFYHDKSVRRIRQDVYDRFFTRIEQRVSRKQILELKGAFADVRISDQIPYWHFLCIR